MFLIIMESDVPLIVPLNEFRCLDCSAMYSTLKSLGEHICEGKNVGSVDANAPPTPFYVDDDSSGRTLDLLWMMERTSGSVPNQKSTEPSGNAADGVDLDLKL
ncbi:MDS1 and EVI1 complex locus protein EVI1 [Sesbania bispinosa]|nr:MDS1 and EVI1 complex locus protein EVI1 [Sesbania bispinosa]